MKYVIIGDAFPIILHEAIEHRSVVGETPATSAGFVAIKNVGGIIQARCYGHSQSLNMSSAPDDSELIENFLNP